MWKWQRGVVMFKTSDLLKLFAQANRDAAIKFNDPFYSKYADTLDNEACVREASEIIGESEGK